FQAEDGIRDPLVTGVQTCALPISSLAAIGAHVPEDPGVVVPEVAAVVVLLGQGHSLLLENVSKRREVQRLAVGDDAVEIEDDRRSEERRVGKECRAGRARLNGKKK